MAAQVGIAAAACTLPWRNSVRVVSVQSRTQLQCCLFKQSVYAPSCQRTLEQLLAEEEVPVLGRAAIGARAHGRRHVLVSAFWRQHWRWPGSGAGDGAARQTGGIVERAHAAGACEARGWMEGV
eukprot:983629-Prorocentrum_lima.AAC.1